MAFKGNRTGCGAMRLHTFDEQNRFHHRQTRSTDPCLLSTHKRVDIFLAKLSLRQTSQLTHPYFWPVSAL